MVTLDSGVTQQPRRVVLRLPKTMVKHEPKHWCNSNIG